MSTQIINPVAGCTRLAAGAWHYAPCGLFVRKAVIPGIRHTWEQLPAEVRGKQTSATSGILTPKKRPLRQRMCRFVFREFLRSCGLSPRMFHLEALRPWQIALGAGTLGALMMWILA